MAILSVSHYIILYANIDGSYMDGISITHGEPQHHHIWSYVAGHSEKSTRANAGPVHALHNIKGLLLLSLANFVGNDYYCESGNPTDSLIP